MEASLTKIDGSFFSVAITMPSKVAIITPQFVKDKEIQLQIREFEDR